MPKYTIAYLGNHQPDVEAANRWSTESQVGATLEALGHRVLRLQENAVEWDLVEFVASQADMLLWTTTWCREPLGGFAMLKRLRERGVPTVAFHLDLFWGLAREPKLREDPMFACEHVFTADGGHPDEWAAAGITHHWSPPAVYGPECVAGRPRPEVYACDVAFVGSYPYPHPEHAPARAQIIRFCQGEFRGKFRVWRGGVRGEDLSDLYATAKVVVGDSCMAGRLPRYWSDRVPETLGRGGFLVHPYVEGIEDHYTDGEHLRLFQAGDIHQLRELVRHYLANEDERRLIAATGQRHVIANHTYTHRMVDLLRVVLEGAPARDDWRAEAWRQFEALG